MELPEDGMQWAVRATKSGSLQIQRIPIPEPVSGEVLIKCMAAPLNPSDIYMMKGYYDENECFKITYPNVPGVEGAGLVVKSGGGWMGWRSIGKRCCFVRRVHNTNEF